MQVLSKIFHLFQPHLDISLTQIETDGMIGKYYCLKEIDGYLLVIGEKVAVDSLTVLDDEVIIIPLRHQRHACYEAGQRVHSPLCFEGDE